MKIHSRSGGKNTIAEMNVSFKLGVDSNFTLVNISIGQSEFIPVPVQYIGFTHHFRVKIFTQRLRAEISLYISEESLANLTGLCQSVS